MKVVFNVNETYRTMDMELVEVQMEEKLFRFEFKATKKDWTHTFEIATSIDFGCMDKYAINHMLSFIFTNYNSNCSFGIISLDSLIEFVAVIENKYIAGDFNQ